MRFSKLLTGLALALFSTLTFAQAIDINTASADQLDKVLKGVGPKKAEDIVKYREANGPFKSLDDLAKVPGIKQKALEKLLAENKGMLTVGAAAPAVPAVPAVPAMPAAPAAPAVPTVPAVPAMPAAPAAPAVPAVPAAPAVPAVPAVPAMPAAPAAPAVPAVPAMPPKS